MHTSGAHGVDSGIAVLEYVMFVSVIVPPDGDHQSVRKDRGDACSQAFTQLVQRNLRVVNGVATPREHILRC